MKYRNDFVTNSSSSSFIVNFKNKKEMLEAFQKLEWEPYISSYTHIILKDIENNRITFKQALEKVLERAVWDVQRKYYYSDYLQMQYPNRKEYVESPEYKEKLKEHLLQIEENFRHNVSSRGIFAEISYSDHTPDGSRLEHDIMPGLPFVVKVFDNH